MSLKYFLIYIIVINIYGFILVFVDKKRAINKKWRIPEAKLFSIASLFGSIGILSGMYIFHHKTKHYKFTIGIPAILILQIVLLTYFYQRFI